MHLNRQEFCYRPLCYSEHRTGCIFLALSLKKFNIALEMIWLHYETKILNIDQQSMNLELLEPRAP